MFGVSSPLLLEVDDPNHSKGSALKMEASYHFQSLTSILWLQQMTNPNNFFYRHCHRLLVAKRQRPKMSNRTTTRAVEESKHGCCENWGSEDSNMFLLDIFSTPGSFWNETADDEEIGPDDTAGGGTVIVMVSTIVKERSIAFR